MIGVSEVRGRGKGSGLAIVGPLVVKTLALAIDAQPCRRFLAASAGSRRRIAVIIPERSDQLANRRRWDCAVPTALAMRELEDRV